MSEESPLWLLASTQRSGDALKSLQWLRGSVPPETVSNEFNDLQRYAEFIGRCVACEKAKVKCNHPKATIRDKFKDSMRKRTVKPFIIVTSLSLISRQFSGTAALRPYIVSILNAHGIAFEANFMTVLLGLIGIFGGVCVMSTVKVLGKRKIYLLSSIGSLLSCFGLSNVKFCFYAL